MKEMNFAPEFVKIVWDESKNATTRLIRKEPELGNIREGDLVTCTQGQGLFVGQQSDKHLMQRKGTQNRATLVPEMSL